MKKIVLMLFIFASLLLFNSCNKLRDYSIGGDILKSEEDRVEERTEQIVSAIKNRDREAVKSLFSQKALEETEDIEGGIDYLFNFIKGDIENGEGDESYPSSESIRSGKRSWMSRFCITLNTDQDDYVLFVVDYNIDTINPDNEGVYMLEMRREEEETQLSWMERLEAGIHKMKLN